MSFTKANALWRHFVPKLILHQFPQIFRYLCEFLIYFSNRIFQPILATLLSPLTLRRTQAAKTHTHTETKSIDWPCMYRRSSHFHTFSSQFHTGLGWSVTFSHRWFGCSLQYSRRGMKLWLSLSAKGESIIQIIWTWQCFVHHMPCYTRTPNTID